MTLSSALAKSTVVCAETKGIVLEDMDKRLAMH
jgi:hypothetical protein